METLGKINNRIVNFTEHSAISRKNVFPKQNWCIVIIAKEKNTKLFSEIINAAIEKNVAYICGIGEQHDLILDTADEEIEFREV